MSLLTTLAIAGSGMAAQTQRLTAVASNLANADSVANASGTPYRAREVVFQAVPAKSEGDAPGAAAAAGMDGVRVAAVVQSAEPLRTVYDPGSSFADSNGYVQLPNVNPIEEMVNMISAQQAYQADLEAFNVAKTLALRTLSI
jgi:flagellar basal-body rod protein FlgC